MFSPILYQNKLSVVQMVGQKRLQYLVWWYTFWD